MTTTRAPKLCAFPNCGQPTNGVKVSPPSAPVAVEPIFPDQTCIECGIEHPGLPCSQPDLFGEPA